MDAFIGMSKKKKFMYPLETLKKHMFAFGGSGSGKTVLSKVMIEEAALNDIPCILVDPQGDLASLILPEDKTEGSILNKYKDQINVTIFTPISSKGIPICINPLNFDFKNNDPEEIIPLINEIAVSIAKLLGYNTNNDQGKSAAAILYTVIKYHYEKKENIGTFTRLAQIVAEIREGNSLSEEISHFTKNEKDLDMLLRKIKFLTVGQKELMFQFGMPLDIDVLLGKDQDKTQISVLYLNTLTSQEEKEFFLTIVATKLYQWMLNNPSDKLQALFYIDEVAPFIPAGSEKPMPKPVLMLLFKQARKYGLGLLIATQNPGDIDYKAFAQFGTWAIGRLTTKQDQKKVENALKSIIDKDISTKLPKLKPGNFIIFSPDISSDLIELQVRWLYTKHKTMTDIDVKKVITKEVRKEYEQLFVKPEKKIDNRLLEEDDQESDLNEESLEIEEHSEEEGCEKHFPVLVDDRKMNQLIRSNTKKNILLQPKEKLGNYKLVMEPIIKTTIAKKNNGMFSKDIGISTILFDAKTGRIIKTGKMFTYYNEFEKLWDQNEIRVRVIRYLVDKPTDVSAADISLKLNLPKASVTKALKDMQKKKIVACRKEGKIELWFSMLAQKEYSFNLNDISSSLPQLTMKKLKAKVDKQKIPIKKLENLVRNWFDAEITEHELIYLPIYVIDYVNNHGTRRVIINGFTGRAF